MPLGQENEQLICKSLDFLFLLWSPDGISEQETLNLSQLAHNNDRTTTRRMRFHHLRNSNQYYHQPRAERGRKCSTVMETNGMDASAPFFTPAQH
jgi:hypothetical protein